MAIDGTRVFTLAKGVSLQSLGDREGAVVLTVETGQLYTCNDTTAAFLAAIDGKRSFAQIVAELHSKFDVSTDELRTDLSALSENLMDDGILV